jgi:hypothetical protein
MRPDQGCPLPEAANPLRPAVVIEMAGCSRQATYSRQAT